VGSIRKQPLARKQHVYTLLPVDLPLVHARCESRVLLKRTSVTPSASLPQQAAYQHALGRRRMRPHCRQNFRATLSIQRTTVTECQACVCTAAQPHLAFGHASIMSRLLASRNHIHNASRNDIHLQRLPSAPILAPGVARAQGLHAGALVPCSSGKAPLQTLDGCQSECRGLLRCHGR
jgi:hypothetical protein